MRAFILLILCVIVFANNVKSLTVSQAINLLKLFDIAEHDMSLKLHFKNHTGFEYDVDIKNELYNIINRTRTLNQDFDTFSDMVFNIILVFSIAILILSVSILLVLFLKKYASYLFSSCDIIICVITGLYISCGLYYDYIIMLICCVSFILTAFIIHRKYSANESFINISMLLTIVFVILEDGNNIDFLKPIISVLMFLSTCFCVKIVFGDVKCKLDNKASFWIAILTMAFYLVDNFITYYVMYLIIYLYFLTKLICDLKNKQNYNKNTAAAIPTTTVTVVVIPPAIQ